MKLHMLVGALALCAAFDAGATMIHDYELNGSLADTLGGAALGARGGTLDASGYRFGFNQGLARLRDSGKISQYLLEIQQPLSLGH